MLICSTIKTHEDVVLHHLHHLPHIPHLHLPLPHHLGRNRGQGADKEMKK